VVLSHHNIVMLIFYNYCMFTWWGGVECWSAGVIICLERGADLHMAQLMPLPLAVSCFSKIQIGFTFPVLAHPGSPGIRAVKRARTCVCVLRVHTVSSTEHCRTIVFAAVLLQKTLSRFAVECQKRLDCITKSGAKRGLRQPTLDEITQSLVTSRDYFIPLLLCSVYLFWSTDVM